MTPPTDPFTSHALRVVVVVVVIGWCSDSTKVGKAHNRAHHKAGNIGDGY
jgi:hypothetical protein